MKLKTNLFQGKKPSLEEGQMIYQIESDDTVINRGDRTNDYRRCCLQFMKVILYIILILLILLVGLVVVVHLFRIDIPSDRFRGICGTSSLPTYEEWLNQVRDSSILDSNDITEDDIMPESSTTFSEIDQFDVLMKRLSASTDEEFNDEIPVLS